MSRHSQPASTFFPRSAKHDVRRKVRVDMALTHNDVTSSLPRKQRLSFAFFVSGWQHLWKSVPITSDKDPGWFSHVLFLFHIRSSPFIQSQLLLTFICTCYPAAHTLSHTPTVLSSEKEASVLHTKAPLSPECELSFRLKLTVSEGKGRADDGPRIRYTAKCVCNVYMSSFIFVLIWHASCVSLNMGVFLYPIIPLCHLFLWNFPSQCVCLALNVCVFQGGLPAGWGHRVCVSLV